ncbi:CBS domain-containing protein [Nocardia macrotermitis]|uniref:CBS domain-containing protein n=1 Tax=Nocardia macrotermitis TaxID=2585198 RepID=UPI0018860403|nr:CBS domain-containing protein [Nocardia macrotermitis]
MTDDDGNDADDSQSDALPHRPFLVSDLPCATATDILRAKSVRSNDTLQKALHMMQREGLSQIPVIDGVSELKGIVTWRSVATMYLRTGIAHELANAMEPAETVEKHMDLFRELPRLNEHGYLLVRDNTGSLTGIITTADITRRFHDTALPYYLLGEIESRLRSCLSRLDANAIGAILKGKNSIAGLMFGDYLKLLHPESDKYAAAVEANWQSLGWRGVDRAMFVNDLRRVKSVRNSIAHFDPTPPTPEDIDHLRKFSSLLKQLM